MNTPISRREALAGAAAVAATALSRPALGFFDAPTATAAGHWTPVPLISQTIRDRLAERGLPDLGGEGGQWIRSLAFGPDGQTAIWGTDVGGLFRSVDGGTTWEPSNVGFTPRGCTCVMFDPKNADRIVIAAGNSVTFGVHGLYLSTDRGASWRHVLPIKYSGSRDFRKQLAFDETTYDADLGGCRVAYWSRIGDDKPMWGETLNDPALYRTDDGGETWNRLPDTAHLGEAEIECMADGTLLVAGPDGLYRSTDQAASFEKLSGKRMTGLSHSGTRLYACRVDRVFRSDDAGDTWIDITGPTAAPETRLRHVEASPADPNRVGVFRIDDTWSWVRFVSHDGGDNWTAASVEDDLAFLPQNVRHARFAWHATDPNVCLATGGDWPTKSTDGGKTFHWSAAGVNNILVGGQFHFSRNDPDVMFVGSQDYNGAITTDGGRTWTYCNAADEEWGGFTYGGYAVDSQTMWVGEAASWGGGRLLRISRDGGATWSTVAGVEWSKEANAEGGPHGLDTSFASGASWFAGPFRSTDAGQTWTHMPGCCGVIGGVGDLIFGAGVTSHGQRRLVAWSRDDGATWQHVRLSHDVSDISYDPATDTALVIAGEQLFRIDAFTTDPAIALIETPADDQGQRRVTGVCHDPSDGWIVYAAQHKNVYAASAAALRSTDGGRTWTVLTRNVPLAKDERDPAGLDGGREAMDVRVHPVTREAWFTTGCYGVWKWIPTDT